MPYGQIGRTANHIEGLRPEGNGRDFESIAAFQPRESVHMDNHYAVEACRSGVDCLDLKAKLRKDRRHALRGLLTEVDHLSEPRPTH
ncbi:MAG: hypothetical protein AUK47_16440 [Deltaproteobacteria bacterium CG2_30_63_29]|nr:MAG: hypothetical protein AUK47_16440 [Deltaproteobacteria bacterium CG2_30_63_29]